MKKIMFVCMGNICRSPAAHAVFEQKVKERGLEAEYIVESSGTHAYHVGEDADPRMRKTLADHGIHFHHPAQRFKPVMLDEYDVVLAMDGRNFRDMNNLAGGHQNFERVQMFRSYDPEGSAQDDVPDPYYGGDGGFEHVFQIVERSCSVLLDELEKQRNQ